jgi:ribosomal protein L12E/L44/L45/RPP1/RPP2
MAGAVVDAVDAFCVARDKATPVAVASTKPDRRVAAAEKKPEKKAEKKPEKKTAEAKRKPGTGWFHLGIFQRSQ